MVMQMHRISCVFPPLKSEALPKYTKMNYLLLHFLISVSVNVSHLYMCFSLK